VGGRSSDAACRRHYCGHLLTRRVLLSSAGNVLSALVWLRLHVALHNSAAIYLASLAVNDAVYLLVGLVLSSWRWMMPQSQQPGEYAILVADVITASARRLEPLLVLAFSVGSCGS